MHALLACVTADLGTAQPQSLRETTMEIQAELRSHGSAQGGLEVSRLRVVEVSLLRAQRSSF